MHWHDSMILYFVMTITMVIIFRSTETVTSSDLIKNVDDCITNKTTNNHRPHEELIALSDGEKQITLLTTVSMDLSEDTSVYDTSLTTLNRLHRRSSSKSDEDQIDSHVVLLPNPNEDMEEFLSLDRKEFDEQLINEAMTTDGSGDTIEPTLGTTSESTEQTTTTTLPPEITPSGDTIFLLTLNCTNAFSILIDIIDQLTKRFSNPFRIDYDNSTLVCSRSSNIDVLFTIQTSDNVTILTDLFQTLESITSTRGISLQTINTCGTNLTVSNVTWCYLINLCNLCGTNPRRGICLPERNVSRCQCFIDENNPSITYIDEFCKIPKDNSIRTSIASWIPIVIGILSGIIVLFCVITIILFIRSIRHRRIHSHSTHPISRYQYIFREPTGIQIQNFSSDIHQNRSLYDPIAELDAIIDNHK